MEGLSQYSLWAILLLPLFSAILIHFFMLDRPGLARITGTATILICFGLTLLLFPAIQSLKEQHTLPYEMSLEWISLKSLTLHIGVMLDGLSHLMLLVVTGIGSLIFIYSTSYMKEDTSCARFFACLCLFVFSMLGIVLSNNLIQIFIFWELVGLSSYLLIGFWYEKHSASTASKKAFLTTRVGDVGMMIGILLLFSALSSKGHGTFSFVSLKELHHHMAMGHLVIDPTLLTAIVLCLFMGVMGKSAQLPLHVWLPDAMEGPTPVSALIHAATMVAAGVFLLARLDFLLELSKNASMVIAWIGGITALMAATIAVVQNDLKKILAYSTLSQLGYMVMAMGLHSTDAGMFHLTTHAFFKALLFLGAGSLIHAFHTQDIWLMQTKGLLKKMPVTAGTFIIGTLALMGIPPLSGFFSKEEILFAAEGGPKALFIIAMIVVFMTAFYMGRLSSALFFPKMENEESHSKIHEADFKIQIPLIVLGILSIIGGYLPIREWIASDAHHGAHHGHHEGSLVFILSFGLAIGGFLFALFLYRASSEGLSRWIPIFKKSEGILQKKYFFDEFYDGLIVHVQENLACLMDWFEKVFVIRGMVNWTASVPKRVGRYLCRLQNGAIQYYALLFAFGVFLVIFFMLFKVHA